MNSLEERQLRARIGVQAEQFKSSELGQVMLARAEVLGAKAVNDLLKTDPTNETEIRRLQNEHKLSIRFLQWIDDIITEGMFERELLESDAT